MIEFAVVLIIGGIVIALAGASLDSLFLYGLGLIMLVIGIIFLPLSWVVV